MLFSAAKLLVRPLLVTGAVLALVATGQAGLSGRPSAPTTTSYTLQWGDTLSKVATKFGVSVDQLAAANGIANIHKVIAGTKLTIPTTPPAQAPAATPTTA